MEGINIIFDPERTKQTSGRNICFTLEFNYQKFGFRQHYRDDTPRKNAPYKTWTACECYLEVLPVDTFYSTKQHSSIPLSIVTDAMLWMERNKQWVLGQFEKELR